MVWSKKNRGFLAGEVLLKGIAERSGVIAGSGAGISQISSGQWDSGMETAHCEDKDPEKLRQAPSERNQAMNEAAERRGSFIS